jgi:hypothetical protein
MHGHETSRDQQNITGYSKELRKRGYRRLRIKALKGKGKKKLASTDGEIKHFC